jgi:hypothetical protein
MLAGYEVLDKENAIPLKTALEAAKSRGRPEIAAHGGAREGALPHGAGPGHGHKKEETHDSALSLRLDGKEKPKKAYGNSPSYLADRMRRDRPDVFSALERGEYRSIREAALAAGLSHLVIQKRINISDDPIKIVAALKRVCSPAVLATVGSLLRSEEDDTDSREAEGVSGLIRIETSPICGRCNRPLTDEVSMKRGMGPVCYGKSNANTRR